jgi:transcriptional regulator with XRE-family HTH domain
LHFDQNRFPDRNSSLGVFARHESREGTVISETLASGLERYRIGPKLRLLRLRKKLGLVQLGRHTGLSSAMLSKIERGLLFPTLPTLLRISLVFGVSLEYFFKEDPKQSRIAVVRKKDRLRLPDRPDANPAAYLFECLNFPVTERRMDAFYAEFPRDAGPSEAHRHDGAEVIYVLQGKLAVTVDVEETILSAGDAMYFDSGAEHSYRTHGRTACAAIVVVVP